MQEPERISFNTSTTAFTATEESNFDRIFRIIEKHCLCGDKNRSLRNNVLELMKKSPEPHYSLVLNEMKNLIGVYYIDYSTGYFHRIVGNDDLPIILAPRRVKSFLSYDFHKQCFFNSVPLRFDAVVVK